MINYRIYYMKPEYFPTFITGKVIPDRESLEQTHVELRSVQAESLGAVFMAMQGERWSPNGEARTLIRAKGLEHTSMSVGDVAEDLNSGDMYVCARLGWRKLD